MREGQTWRSVALWGAVAFWMAMIFYGSNQQGLPTATSDALDLIIKKTGHVLEYAVLGLLLLLAWHGTLEAISHRAPGATRAESASENPGWLTPSLLAMAMGCLYAVSDELHQLFVPTRSGNARDVVLDTAAVTLAVALAWLWRRLARRPQQPD